MQDTPKPEHEDTISHDELIANEQAKAPTQEPEQTPEVKENKTSVEKNIQVKNTYAIQEEWHRDTTKEEDQTLSEQIVLPTVTATRREEVVNTIRNIDELSPSTTSVWSEVLRDSSGLVYGGHIHENAVDRPGADYRQAIPSEVGDLQFRSPRITDKENGNYTGNRAASYIRAKVGMGTVKRIPLWHTGIWIALKAPREGDLLDMHRAMLDEKVAIGRQTGGMAFSNRRVYITSVLVDFIASHIFDTTYQDKKADLLDVIRINDLPTLVAGLASMVYPKGFTYEASCMANPEECRHVVHQKANPDKMVWTDYSQLNEYQINHMSRFTGSTMTENMVKEYQAQFKFASARRFMLDEENDIAITLRNPSIRQHINSGQTWVNSLQRSLEEIVSIDLSQADRLAIAENKASVTIMRSHQHYVENIESDNAVVVAGDNDDQITQLLEDITPNDRLREKFFEEIIRFIDDTTISVVAATDFVCPSCGGSQLAKKEENETLKKKGGKRFAELIPIDVENVFFQLLGVREQLVSLRYNPELDLLRKQALNTLKAHKVKASA